MANSRASVLSMDPPSYVSRRTTVGPGEPNANHAGHDTDQQAGTSTNAPLQDTGGEVVLNWTPGDLYDAPNRAVNLQLQALQSTVIASTHEAEVIALPPRYEEARVPTVPITYSFSPCSANSMILIPPAGAADSRPIFHISAQMNVFIPSSYITTVRRGATEDGPEVGSFEMGISIDSATACIRGMEHNFDRILVKQGSRRAAVWQWQFVHARLYWNCVNLPNICRLKEGSVIIAKFIPTKSLRQPRRPALLSTLEVLPEGQKYMDDIVMSILIIERIRRTPMAPDVKSLSLFNFH